MNKGLGVVHVELTATKVKRFLRERFGKGNFKVSTKISRFDNNFVIVSQIVHFKLLSGAGQKWFYLGTLQEVSDMLLLHIKQQRSDARYTA